MKLSKLVQRTEFEERETFTWLMNAVRESHETERNYNQRIKMLSLIGRISTISLSIVILPYC